MKHGGFTLIEVLVVVAIVGILAGIGLVNYSRWRASSTVMDGAQQFAQAINAVRTGVKKANACWQLSLGSTSASNMQYQVRRYSTPTCPATAVPLQTQLYTLPGGTRLVLLDASGAPTSTDRPINFVPPYGTTDASPNTYAVRWAANTDIQRKVRVTSVLGKVIVK
ncbi:Tfp pilus assembly protein FimT/FimU [Deinococcus navajonensis]|uniref:Tfp pilus assembly protein FimT/FimU n=1 Tax=Deinococcus navajonensis TaxID=309884 RepID=A0ABV8XS76_9DEIO